jgi:hypothetical protein
LHENPEGAEQSVDPKSGHTERLAFSLATIFGPMPELTGGVRGEQGETVILEEMLKKDWGRLRSERCSTWRKMSI